MQRTALFRSILRPRVFGPALSECLCSFKESFRFLLCNLQTSIVIVHTSNKCHAPNLSFESDPIARVR